MIGAVVAEFASSTGSYNAGEGKFVLCSVQSIVPEFFGSEPLEVSADEYGGVHTA